MRLDDELLVRIPQRREINWELLAVGAAMIGVCISLFVVSQNQISAIHQEIVGIREDIKDFHGRLCAIEERRGK